MKKAKPVPRRKRPKSVLRKAWETRRARAAQKQINQAKSTSISQIPPSDAAVLRLLEQMRNEQLNCFMADMESIRRSDAPAFVPITVTRTQADAIEQFLSEYGYSAFGQRKVPDKTTA